MNKIDPVYYEPGDVVIRKNKGTNIYGKKPQPETVYKTSIVENERYSYQVVFFYSNPNSFNVALEFEPYDKIEKERYYKLMSTIKSTTSTKPKSKERSSKSTTQDKINNLFKEKLK